jgi:hypothetical protein
MKRKLKLMPDYQCFPLWWSEPGRVGDIDPATLPLSPETRSALDAWAQAFDSRLDLDDPAHSREVSAEEALAFEREGVRLWMRLREELASEYDVSYQSVRLGRVFTEPGQLPR